MKLFGKYPFIYDAVHPKTGTVWTVAVKDRLQYGMFQGKRCVTFSTDARTLRREWRRKTGLPDIPTDPDPFLGCDDVRDFIELTKIYDILSGGKK